MRLSVLKEIKNGRVEVDEINKKLESGEDQKLNELWKKTRELSLHSLEKIYSQLNTHFDDYFFEKDMEKSGKEIVESMLKNKNCKKK